MRDVLADLSRWWRDGRPVGMATVVGTWKSAPRPPGATMLVGPDQTAVGSVSGGCVEAAVYELGLTAIETGQPHLQRYGVSDDDAFSVGLTCGGIIDIFVERIDPASFPQLGEVVAAIEAESPVAVATVISDPGGRVGRRVLVWPDRVDGSLGSAHFDDALTGDVRGMLASGLTGPLRYGLDGERLGDEVTVFVSSYAPPPRMLVFGAIDFASALAKQGAFLGYRVTVCDARPVFATNRRFPGVEVVVDWPHRYLAAEIEAGRVDGRTVVCVLTHDPKFDLPVLQLALEREFAYVGAMGSRRTHDDRVTGLLEAGVAEAQLKKLHSPIGLALGARTPEETAVSITAEIIADRWGGGGQKLSTLDGSIHENLDRR
ncbi:xanthine dehydrogenase accessory factor [Asanoa ishikariensis]|uniref:Xanthine dehydrogenase accessory factor n=1 Tax=Asanoa ishikariensis TaxID=137265 RepID=A0A1H3S5I0_9ACTN|nr:XdhC family protein [Asanoa ishikariensis]SDZ33047.1 xanthine dehydrogenase accessory factor [Asanoa ishikariensis]